MNKLNAEWCRNHIESMKANGLSLLEEKYLQALEIALPILEKQEKGDDGWIRWSGRVIPNAVRGKQVEALYYNGSTECGYSGMFNWGNGAGNLVIAYRVIENDGREG